MVIGPHGASARVMSFTNGPPGLSSLPRRLLSTSSKMTARSSLHPPNWGLWHPSNGVVFQSPPQQKQSPLYPARDVAYFSTDASSATGVGAKADPIQSMHSPKSEGHHAPQQKTSSIAFEQSSSPTADTGPDRFRERVAASPETTSSSWPESPPFCPAISAEKSPRRESPLLLPAKSSSKVNIEDVSAGIAKLDVEEKAPIMTNVPFTPLDFKMSQETFTAAQQARKGHNASFWSHTQYRNTNTTDVSAKQVVQVHYCRSSKTAEEAVQVFVGEKLLGLDLEWYSHANRKSGVRKNVSLMQIASASHVVLLHLALYPEDDEFMTPTLKNILEDPEIRKIGVFIAGDCTRIKTFLGVECQGKFELSHLYKQVKYSASGETNLIDKKLVALAKQIEAIMGLPMKKDNYVRASDWSQPLNEKQLQYAASDAYAGVQLFAMMNHQREQLDPCPDLPFHVELNKPIPLPCGAEAPPIAVALAEDNIADETEIEAPEEVDRTRSSSAAPKGEKAAPIAKKAKVATQAATKAAKGKAAAKEQATVTTQTSGAADQPAPEVKDPRIEAAEVWLKEYRVTRKIRAQPAALRAYHIWHHNQDLTCKTIAKILRNPPIQPTSVANYVLSSVQMERLPYDKERARQALQTLPPEVQRKRYWGVQV